jgi:hypothetical protein
MMNSIPCTIDNPKGKLLEYFQQTSKSQVIAPPVFQFACKVTLQTNPEITFESGWCSSAKIAERDASWNCLVQLKDIIEQHNLSTDCEMYNFVKELDSFTEHTRQVRPKNQIVLPLLNALSKFRNEFSINFQNKAANPKSELIYVLTKIGLKDSFDIGTTEERVVNEPAQFRTRSSVPNAPRAAKADQKSNRPIPKLLRLYRGYVSIAGKRFTQTDRTKKKKMAETNACNLALEFLAKFQETHKTTSISKWYHYGHPLRHNITVIGTVYELPETMDAQMDLISNPEQGCSVLYESGFRAKLLTWINALMNSSGGRLHIGGNAAGAATGIYLTNQQLSDLWFFIQKEISFWDPEPILAAETTKENPLQVKNHKPCVEFEAVPIVGQTNADEYSEIYELLKIGDVNQKNRFPRDKPLLVVLQIRVVEPSNKPISYQLSREGENPEWETFCIVNGFPSQHARTL